MRWFVMSVLLWSVSGWSQVVTSGFDAARAQQLEILGDETEHERLHVEVVLTYVLDVERLGRTGFGAGAAAGGGTEALVAVHRAMDALGAPLLRYNVSVSGRVEVLFCQSATVYFDQRCWYDEAAHPSGLAEWFEDLHSRPGTGHYNGRAVLYAVHLPDGFAWAGSRSGGDDAFYRYRDDRWYDVECRAWALADTTAIAHELGHCFGLEDNGEGFETATGRLDLMRSDYGNEDWLNAANRARMAAFFRDEDRRR